MSCVRRHDKLPPRGALLMSLDKLTRTIHSAQLSFTAPVVHTRGVCSGSSAVTSPAIGLRPRSQMSLPHHQGSEPRCFRGEKL